MEAVAELPLSVAEVEEALSNPEHFGLKEFVWYAFNPPQSFAEKQPDRCLYSRLGVSAEQFELLARQWVLPDTQRAEVLKQKDQSVRNLLLGARRRGAPRLTMVLCRSIKWVERTKVKIRRAPPPPCSPATSRLIWPAGLCRTPVMRDRRDL